MRGNKAVLSEKLKRAQTFESVIYKKEFTKVLSWIAFRYLKKRKWLYWDAIGNLKIWI